MFILLNVKALVGALNQEKALVGAFSVIVETNAIGNGSFAALTITIHISRTKHITIYANYLAYCSFAEGIN